MEHHRTSNGGMACYVSGNEAEMNRGRDFWQPRGVHDVIKRSRNRFLLRRSF